MADAGITAAAKWGTGRQTPRQGKGTQWPLGEFCAWTERRAREEFFFLRGYGSSSGIPLKKMKGFKKERHQSTCKQKKRKEKICSSGTPDTFCTSPCTIHESGRRACPFKNHSYFLTFILKTLSSSVVLQSTYTICSAVIGGFFFGGGGGEGDW